MKRLMGLLVFGAWAVVVSGCESPTLPPIPPEEEETDPKDPNEGGDETGFIQFQDAPLFLA